MHFLFNPAQESIIILMWFLTLIIWFRIELQLLLIGNEIKFQYKIMKGKTNILLHNILQTYMKYILQIHYEIENIISIIIILTFFILKIKIIIL